MDHPRSNSPPPTPAKKARVELPDPEAAQPNPPTSGEEMASQPPGPAENSAPRTIDENTDMTTLTDQEIMRLMEGMDHTEDVMARVCSLPSPSFVFVFV